MGWSDLLSTMKAKDKLKASWSKTEGDLMLHYPLGQCTKSDAHWISGVFNKEFTDELTKRGYDVNTFKFSIEPIEGNERFASQRK